MDRRTCAKKMRINCPGPDIEEDDKHEQMYDGGRLDSDGSDGEWDKKGETVVSHPSTIPNLDCQRRVCRI